jgi:hypothetical protein
MELGAVTRTVHEQLAAAAAMGDEHTQRAAQLLSISLDPALRLALQGAMSQVAGEISAQLAPGRVDLALVGGEVEVRVVPPPPTTEGSAPSAPPSSVAQSGASQPTDDPAEAQSEDSSTTRVSFRPPQHLKTRLDQAAAAEGLSLNAYLVRVLGAHLDAPAPEPPRPGPSGTGRTSGWFI